MISGEEQVADEHAGHEKNVLPCTRAERTPSPLSLVDSRPHSVECAWQSIGSAIVKFEKIEKKEAAEMTKTLRKRKKKALKKPFPIPVYE